MKAPSPEEGMAKTPPGVAYRLPAEWEHHEATWLAWPHDRQTWPRLLAQVEAIYVQMVECLSGGEKVCIMVVDREEEERVRVLLSGRGVAQRISYYQIKTESPWVRDYGPFFLTAPGGERAACLFRFNAWGGKYELLLNDARVSAQFSGVLSLPQFEADMILEGGAIDVNGHGTCLATEQCLLHPNRNPGFGTSRIEHELSRFLSVRHVVWLHQGIAGDDTDGHVDNVARFVGPRTLVVAGQEDRTDANYAPLAENHRRLLEAVDQDGKPLEVVRLPMPEVLTAGPNRLPASYANFYIANHCVLVPIYGHHRDAQALGVLKDLFPGRRVIGIPSTPLVHGLGAIHCITREEPASQSARLQGQGMEIEP